jgi:hypothetical protein
MGEVKAPSRGPALIGWQKKRSHAATEIMLNISPLYLIHVTDGDPVTTWGKLDLVFSGKGRGTVAALRRSFHLMSYNSANSMRDWITKVETTATQLESLNSPMLLTDFINTMMCGLPESYNPLLIHFNGLDDNPENEESINIPYIISHLINEESRQSAQEGDAQAAMYSRQDGKNGQAKGKLVCWWCGEEGHKKDDCDVSPRELRERREGKQSKATFATETEEALPNNITIF